MAKVIQGKSLNLTVNLQSLDHEIREIVEKALIAFNRSDFSEASRLLLSLKEQGYSFRNQQLFLSLCLENLGRLRLARYQSFHECLDYPENQTARVVLSSQSAKDKGKFVNLEFNQTERPPVFPSISLVMIVKNEEDNLASCLEAYRDIVREMIVVDTGSTDRTVEIARSFGARVEFYPWNDDFSAARNESLKYASCDWILRTDADETIEEPEKIKLLHAVGSDQAEVYICHTISKTKDNKVEDVENVRLIKNHLGVTYENPLHESVASSCIRLGLTRAATNIYFNHSGYDLEQTDQQAKAERNLRICKKELENNPKNYFIRLLYGNLLTRLEKKEGLAELEQAIRDLPDMDAGSRYLGEAYFNLMMEYLKRKDSPALQELFQNVETDFCMEAGMIQYEAEVTLYQLGDWHKAAKLFEWASQLPESRTFEIFLPPEKYNLEILQAYLFEVNVLEKRFGEAQRWLRKVESNLSFRSNTSADSLRENARDLLTREEWQKAYETLLAAACKSDLQFQDYCNLAVCQSRLNRQVFAKALIEEAKKFNPSSALLPHIETMIALRENDFQIALEKSVEAFLLEPANANFKANLEKVAAMQKISPPEALRRTGLKWLENGQDQKGLFALTLYAKFIPQDNEINSILAKYLN